MRSLTRTSAALLLACALVLAGASTANASSMLVFVKTHWGPTIPIDVDPAELISEIKQKIFDKAGIPVEQQRLLFEGELLEDGRTAASYAIELESTMRLLPPETPFDFTEAALAPFVLQAAYSSSVRAVGGFGSPTYTVSSGALPVGIVLDSATGALTGTPTTVQQWSFTITARSPGSMLSREFSGVIAPQLAATGADPGVLVGFSAFLVLLGMVVLARHRRSLPLPG